MVKNILTLNKYSLNVRNFFKSHQKLNPFENKLLFCFIPILISWICAIHYHSMYQSSDDWDMRVVLEGSAGGIEALPSNFSMYMTVLYGNFLKIFYSIYPKGYWYDFFQSLFVTLSIYVSTLFVCKDFENKSSVFKSIALPTLSFVSAIATVSPQFTITSGILGVSGVFSFFMIADNYFKEKKHNILCALYCVFSFSFGSMIRYNSCLVGAFYTGVLLLPFWPYRDLKTLVIKSIIPFISAMIVLGIYIANNHLIDKDPLWKEGIEKNVARALIQDQTTAWDHPTEMWYDLEDKLDEIKDKDFIFSKADYRMLLTTSYLGDQDIYSAENLKKVSRKLSPLVSLSKTRLPAFRIGDYRDNFKGFVILFLALSIISAKKIKLSIYFAFCFFLIIVALNYPFRDTPYRLWYVFVFSTIFSEIKFSLDKSKSNENILYFILFSILSFLPLKKQIYFTLFQYNVSKDIRSSLKLLDKNKKYIIDFMFKESFVRPFKINPFIINKILFLDTSPLNHFTAYQTGNGKDFWFSVCNDENVEYLIHQSIWGGPFTQYKKAVSYYMKEKYGKRVFFIYKNILRNMYSVKCVILNKKEIELREKYKEEVVNVYYNSPSKISYVIKNAKNDEDAIYLFDILRKSSDFIEYKFIKKYFEGYKSMKQGDIEDIFEKMRSEEVVE